MIERRKGRNLSIFSSKMGLGKTRFLLLVAVIVVDGARSGQEISSSGAACKGSSCEFFSLSSYDSLDLIILPSPSDCSQACAKSAWKAGHKELCVRYNEI